MTNKNTPSALTSLNDVIYFSTHTIVLSPEAAEMNRRVRLGFPLSEGQFCLRRMDEAKKDMAKKS